MGSSNNRTGILQFIASQDWARALYLPTARGKITTESDAGFIPAPQRGSETVLVVEDDEFVRGYAVACLESLGYNVITAKDGRSALALLHDCAAPDILFTDVVMPGGVSGFDLAEQALALKPGLQVLLASGYPLETLTARGKLNAKYALLHKPYRKADLAFRIRSLLDAR